ASMDEGWTRWVLDQYKKESIGFNLTYSSIKDVDLVSANLELRLVARETDIPYETREQAEVAAKSAKTGSDPYTKEWEAVAYCDPRASGLRQVGWIVVSKNPVVTSRDMRDVSLKPTNFTNFGAKLFDIDFSLTPEGAMRLSEASGAHISDHLAITLNGEVR